MKLLIENNEIKSYKYIEHIKIPYGVTSIGEYAFIHCEGLVSVGFPNTVTHIGYCAFQGCYNLEYAIIPDSVTYIGNYVFEGCTHLTIYCNKGSYAEKYCKKNNIKYEVTEW